MMNRLLKVVDGLWSLACIFATVGLFGLFLYWTVLQRPYLSVDVQGMATEYEAPAGSIVYVENPIFPPDTLAQVDLQAELKGVDVSYKLASPSESDAPLGETPPPSITRARPGYPVYPLFIPSYVRTGVYRYEVTATYKLNPFKTERLQLPPIQITVY